MTVLRFDGRSAIVTGGARGIGRAHVEMLVERGADVIVADLPGPALDRLGDELADRGGTVRCVATDLTRPGAADELVGRAVHAFGGVDIVINNAGIVRDAPFPEVTDDDLEALLDVHLRAPLRLVRALWPVMVSRGGGRVVNTTSNAALFGKAGMSSYAAVKSALVGWTRSLAIEGRDLGIAVNAVAPIARTRMTDGLLGDLDDALDPHAVAAVVAWLAHRACPLTGEVVSAAAGNVSRVVAGRISLVTHTGLTPEQVAAAWSSDLPLGAVTLPASAADEVAHLRHDLSAARTTADHVAGARPSDRDDRPVATAIQRKVTEMTMISDHDAIRRLFADYCHLVDDGDHDRWIELFTSDASIELGRQTFTGRAEVLGWIQGVAEASPLPTRHFNSNHAIDATGDEASSLSDWMLVEAGGRTVTAGRYADVLRRVDGVWRIARRRITFLRAPSA